MYRSKLSIVALLFIACSQVLQPPRPHLGISSDLSEPLEGDAAPYHFGSVDLFALDTHTFAVGNDSSLSVELKSIRLQGDIQGDIYKLVESPASAGTGACVPGAVLSPNDYCLVSVQFEPIKNENYEATVMVDYAEVVTLSTDGSEPATPTNRTAQLKLLGTGSLNCSLEPTLSASEDQGSNAASVANEANREQGQNAGEALTRDDGFTDSYSSSYQSAYRSAYDGPNGYDRGYPIGYNQGYALGSANILSCVEARNDGAEDGLSDGSHDGDFDGYNDGYNRGEPEGSTTGYANGYDQGYVQAEPIGFSQGQAEAGQDGSNLYNQGYNNGFSIGDSDGYSLGYSDGLAACSFQDDDFSDDKRRASQKAEVTQGLINACFNKGYDFTYEPNAYSNAFDLAKSRNTDYQAGFSQGTQEGTTTGTAEGKTDGYNDGLAQGQDDGFLEATDDVYRSCYQEAYNSNYQDNYEFAYDASFSRGYQVGFSEGEYYAFDDGYDDGYDDGFSDGYAEGYSRSDDPHAYDDGYTAGYDTGFPIAYDRGYGDGYYASCGTELKTQERVRRISLLKKAKTFTRANLAGEDLKKVRDKAQISLKANRETMKRRPKLAQKMYGANESWWKTKSGTNLSGSTFTPSKLPAFIAKSLSGKQEVEMASIRDAKNPLSFRSFLLRGSVQKVQTRTIPRKSIAEILKSKKNKKK